MENESLTWGYWILGILQIFVVLTFYRVGRLMNVCDLAQDWAEVTQSLHYNISEFADKVETVSDEIRAFPLQLIGIFFVNFMLIYYIGEGGVPLLMQIIAAAVNSTMVVMFFNVHGTTTGIVSFVNEVEFMNQSEIDASNENGSE